MSISHEERERLVFGYNFGECSDIVSNDVRDTLMSVSREYLELEDRVVRLSFSSSEMSREQSQQFDELTSAFADLDQVVSDRLWAAGLHIAIQMVTIPGFSAEEYIEQCLTTYETQPCITAVAQLRQAYGKMRTGLPESLHQRLEEYSNGKVELLAFTALTTMLHGFEFGLDTVEQLGYSLDPAQANTVHRTLNTHSPNPIIKKLQ